MIIVDFQQVCYASLAMHAALQNKNHQAPMNIDMVRHMVLNSLRSYKSRFGAEYGNLVLACDDQDSWRKSIFPYYKVHRRKARSASLQFDWTLAHQWLETIKKEIDENLPYPVVQVKGAEGDDIVAALSTAYSKIEKVLIISGDHDFIQLKTSSNVSQYDPVHKNIVHNYHERDIPMLLKGHILQGDRGDSIPNVLSTDNCFVIGRQKPLRQKIFDNLLVTDPSTYEPDIKRNFERNKLLVDLSCTPEDIKRKIYDIGLVKKNDRTKIRMYLAKNKLNKLLESLGDF